VHRNEHEITVLKLHYMADPDKAQGEPVYIKTLDRSVSPWAYKQFKQMTDSNLYLQEFEIEAEATLGQLIYQLDKEATLEKSFPIDPKWTRRMALDPHPSVPHAFLWAATDPWGDVWFYREFWPSKACYRYDNGKKIGKAGPCPDDEPVFRIRDYVEIVRYLESAENPENTWDGKGFNERIHARVIDYAARAFGKGTNDDTEQPNFQKRFEQYMIMPNIGVYSCPYFDDAKKDRDIGFEMVNAGLKARLVEGSDGNLRKTSKFHIFADKCPELIYEFENIRRQVLTPQQQTTKDPTGKAVDVRAHLGDCARYLSMADPSFIDYDARAVSDWHPRTSGIAY
jgi:RimJ/RimL family protein N-acetyltransferase